MGVYGWGHMRGARISPPERAPRSPFRRPWAVLAAACAISFAGGCGGDSGHSPETAAILAGARALAGTYADEIPPEDNVWSWGPAVLMFGMLDLAEVTGERRWSDYALAWLRHHIARGFAVWSDDTSAPALSAVVLLQARGAEVEDVRVAVDRVADYLFHRAPRLADGGISHMGFLPVFYEKTIWVDGLFMFGPFFVRGADLESDPAWLDEALLQLEVFAEHLKHAPTGFFTHAYSEPKDSATPPLDDEVFWSRGNGWVLYAMVEILSALPPGHPSRPGILADALDLERAVVATQDPTGLWWTVANHPGEGYTETAASGLFTAALARGARIGLFGAEAREAARKGMEGLRGRLRTEGKRTILGGTSKGTGPGNLWMYTHVPLDDQVDYGVGAFLLAAAELARLGR